MIYYVRKRWFGEMKLNFTIKLFVYSAKNLIIIWTKFIEIGHSGLRESRKIVLRKGCAKS